MWFLCFISRSKPERDTHKESILLLLLLLLLPHLSRSTRVRSPQWTDDLTHPAPATVLPAARCSWKMHWNIHQPWYRVFHGFKLRENPS
jgi:hypothetical protein